MLFDSGDTIQGTPFEQFPHVRWSEPSPTIAAMNLIGYDAMAVGNHEFNFGLEVLRRAEDQAEFPFLSANTIDLATDEPAFPTHMVIEADEIRIGVVGLVTPNIPGWEQPEHYRGLAFLPMDEVAREQIRLLRDAEGCDLVVVLAHTGFERDLDDGAASGTEIEDFGWRLAQIPGIDVLLTGHTHQDIPPRDLHGTIVSQPRARAHLLTRIDLELELRDGDWQIASWEGRNLTLDGVTPDPVIAGTMAELHERVAEALDGPVGLVGEPVSVAGCRLHDCAALDLIHQVQLEASGADLSLASLLTDRTPDLPAGPVTWRWIYAFYVYPNTLVKVAVDRRRDQGHPRARGKLLQRSRLRIGWWVHAIDRPLRPALQRGHDGGGLLPSGPHPDRWATGCAICASVVGPSIFTRNSPSCAITIAPPGAVVTRTSATPIKSGGLRRK